MKYGFCKKKFSDMDREELLQYLLNRQGDVNFLVFSEARSNYKLSVPEIKKVKAMNWYELVELAKKVWEIGNPHEIEKEECPNATCD